MVLCNIGYPPETRLKLLYHELSFVHNIQLDIPIVLKFCPELCEKYKNDWTTESNVMDERDFARFQIKISFGRISYIAQQSRLLARQDISNHNICHVGSMNLCPISSIYTISVLINTEICRYVLMFFKIIPARYGLMISPVLHMQSAIRTHHGSSLPIAGLLVLWLSKFHQKHGRYPFSLR